MAILEKLFGGQKDYPPLDPSSQVARRLENARGPLEEFARKVQDPLEVFPTDRKAWVFIGKPPKKFGVVWIEDGKVNNFKALAEEKKLSPMVFQVMSDSMREAYERSESAERKAAIVANRKIVVTASDSLGQEMDRIIRQADS